MTPVIANWLTCINLYREAAEQARSVRARTTPALNILGVFGLARRELPHSQSMAWFLKADSPHEQGALFLKALLERCKISVPLDGRHTVWPERPERVDVAAFQKGRFALFIENKVDHHEREEQIADLQTALVKYSKEWGIAEENRIALFLTEDGRGPKTAHSKKLPGFREGNLFSMSRVEVFELFRTALNSVPGNGKSPLLVAFLDGYIQAISTH